jgi:signal transduction histidine kinase
LGFVSYLLRPLRKIIDRKINTASHPEKFDFTPVATTTADFRQLDACINQMMHKLKDAFLLEKTFVDNASHELLTPIAVLRSRFDNMVADHRTPAHVAKRLLESQETLHKMSQMVQALLCLARIENEQYLKEDTVNLRVLTEEVLDEMEDRLAFREVRVEAVFNGTCTLHSCNQFLLLTLLRNLVSNAIKYNVPKGSIRIRQYPDAQGYAWEIADTGVGIAPENLAAIFDNFAKARNASPDSHGIGLRLAKTIADFHGIDIKVSSQPGVGSVFTLLFPATIVA